MERRFPVAVAAALLGVSATCTFLAPAWSTPAISDQQLQVARLTANVQLAEDFSHIEKLQRAYGYYVDKGLWEDLSQLFH